MRTSLSFLWYSCIATLFLFCRSPLAAETVVIVYPAGQDVFAQFASELKNQWLDNRYTLQLQAFSEDDPPFSAAPDTRLLIAAGSQALQRLANAKSSLPVLSVLSSRQSVEMLTARWRSREQTFTAIYHDPPARRQLALARLLLPQSESFAYLYSPVETPLMGVLQVAARLNGLQMRAQLIEDSARIPLALMPMLASTQFLLASANAEIYNSSTIKTILTASYHNGKVLIGSSPAFVRAGSLATTYSTPTDIARQCQELLQRWRGEALPAADYARYFEVSLNADVARSLNLPVPDIKQLQQQLQALEPPP